jgi:WD40 repeat protein
MAFSSDSRWIALAQEGQTIDLYDLEGFAFIARLSFSSWNLPSTYQVHVHFSPNDTELVSVVYTPSEIFINRWDLNTMQPTTAFNIENTITSFINPGLDLMGTITESNLMVQSLTYSEESDALPLPSNLPPSFWEDLARDHGEIIPSTTGNFVLINNGSSIAHWQITKDTVTYRLNDYPLILENPCLEAANTCRNRDNEFSWSCANEPNIPPVELIAMTPDHVMALISLNEGRTEFRRVSDGLLAWEIDKHFTDITLSPGSEFFFGVRPDGTIEKRTTLDGALMDKLNQHPNRLYDLDFSPDGAVLAVGYDDGWVRVYSTDNGELLGFLTGDAQSLEFSPDGSLLGAGLADGTVRIFILDEGRFYDLPGGHLDAITDLSFSSDGQQILTGSKDCTASVWDIKDRYRVQNIRPDRDRPFRITTVGYAMDDGFKFFTGDNRGITIVSDNEIQEVAFSEDDEIVTFVLEPEQNLLAATGTNTWLLPLTPAEMTHPYPLSPDTDAFGTALDFTPDGSVLIVATQQALTYWSPMDGSFLGSLDINQSILSGSQPAALVISPDGTLIALAASNGLINIFGIP